MPLGNEFKVIRMLYIYDHITEIFFRIFYYYELKLVYYKILLKYALRLCMIAHLR